MKKSVRVLQISLIVLGAVFLLYSIVMSFVINYNTGILLVAGAGVLLITGGMAMHLLLRQKWLIVLLCCMLACLLAMVSFLAFHARKVTVNHTEDAILVLGAGIDGDKVPPQLANRLDTAVALFWSNPSAVIVVSGGQGAEEWVTEAYAMEQYLLDKGIPQQNILREEASTSTRENIANTQNILQAHFSRAYTVTLVTSDYHVYRAGRVAAALHLDCSIVGAPTVWYELPIRYMRECLAVAKMWVFG